MDSLVIRKDQHIDSLTIGNNSNSAVTSYSSVTYLDNLSPQTNLILGNDFKVQLVNIGNIVVFSWNAVLVQPGTGGQDIVSLAFATQIPIDLRPAINVEGDGQNGAILTSNGFVFLNIWINTDGVVHVATTGDIPNIVADSGNTATLFPGSMCWTI